MSWTDRQSIRVIKYLKDKFKIKTFVETGTFKGINAELHSKHFDKVMTCENQDFFYEASLERLNKYKNVVLINEESPTFIKKIVGDKYIFYLDAHFYNPRLPSGKGKFIVLKELANMRKFKNSIIILHDFDNGLGHIKYDGMRLDMNLVKKSLLAINKNFKFYTNRLESCDIVKPTKTDILKSGLPYDTEVISNLKYAQESPRLTYRGLLYCLPDKLKLKELEELGLREWI